MELHGYKGKVNKGDVGLSKKVCFHSETNIKLAELHSYSYSGTIPSLNKPTSEASLYLKL